MKAIQQTIKYDAERDREFPQRIMSHPGGEKLYGCIQCGTCSATCPVSIYMDHTPRQLMALTRAGFKDEVLNSRTIWLCASCYACTVDCPKEIKITDIMYALKREAIREGAYPKRFPIPVLAREFFKMVRKHGRVSETQLVMRLFLLTNWLAMLKTWRLGINLMRTGRFSLKTERMDHPEKLAALLNGGPK
jgi:quinone-modifying oxidoreductase, subunit QmoC